MCPSADNDESFTYSGGDDGYADDDDAVTLVQTLDNRCKQCHQNEQQLPGNLCLLLARAKTLIATKLHLGSLPHPTLGY